MCRFPSSFPSILKRRRDKYFVSSSTQILRLSNPILYQIMDSKVREATLHVSPVLRGGLTHQNEQRPSKCAVLAAEETTASAKHVAHHNGMELSRHYLKDSYQNLRNPKSLVPSTCPLPADSPNCLPPMHGRPFLTFFFHFRLPRRECRSIHLSPVCSKPRNIWCMRISGLPKIYK